MASACTAGSRNRKARASGTAGLKRRGRAGARCVCVAPPLRPAPGGRLRERPLAAWRNGRGARLPHITRLGLGFVFFFLFQRL